MKRIILTGSLIAGLAVLPYRTTEAQTVPQPKWVVEAFCLMVVIGVSATIYLGLKNICNKNLAPPPPHCPCDGTQGCGCHHPPPAADQLTQGQPPANPSVNGKGMVLNDLTGTALWDVSTNGWTDAVSGLPVYRLMQTRLMSSPDVRTWSEEYFIEGWVSDSGIMMRYSRAGVPVMTNYATVATGATMFVPLDIGGREPKKFFRLEQP